VTETEAGGALVEESEAKTHQRLRDEVPRVYRRVLARAIAFAKDKRVLAHFGGHAGKAAEDLVQEAVVRTLRGKRKWNPDAVDLEHFLVQAVRSIADSYKLRGSRRASEYDDALGGADDANAGLSTEPAPSPAQTAIRQESLAMLEDELIQAAGDDENLLQFVEALLSGVYLPRELQQHLSWDEEKVNVVFRKLRRRMRRRRETEGKP
jgi:DNA-directed RNA polymerase specialized sigma24 family protein